MVQLVGYKLGRLFHMQTVLEWDHEKAQNTSDNIQSKVTHWSGMHAHIHI